MAQRFNQAQAWDYVAAIVERVETLRPVETPAERSDRLEGNRQRLGFELWRAKVLLAFGLVVLGIVLACCLVVLLVPCYGEQRRQWAVPVLTSILSSAASAALAYKAGTADK
ncbi:MAG TPA: hypothetical protein VG406_08015 [Isosphaeraceae bacterium]|jgi:hypothetical protein|nr:hypothetical protein [Isosphaeraceae bacterium]